MNSQIKIKTVGFYLLILFTKIFVNCCRIVKKLKDLYRKSKRQSDEVSIKFFNFNSKFPYCHDMFNF